jgi:hypothetical protein
MNYHLGEWISVEARAERTPPRFTLSVALGELPEGWPRVARHARSWSGIVGLLLIAPFVALLSASALQNAGVNAPYGWLSSSSAAIIAGSISLFIGIPVAIAMNLWRITHLGWRRRPGSVNGLIALEVAPLHLIVVLAALIVGGAFVAHLAADSYACLNGIRSAC